MINLVLAASYLILLLVKALSAVFYASRFPKQVEHENLGQVSILQPILSGDEHLSDTLAANLHPLHSCQFFWLIDEDDVCAQQIADQLIHKYPHVRINKILYPQAPSGVNPKLFKLELAWRQSETQYCVVLDDDTVLPKTSLCSLISSLDTFELSTGLPFYKANGNFMSRLLAQFVNNNSAMTYLSTLPYMAPVSINGMCYAIKKQTLSQIDGFKPILHHLTDDMAMALHIRKKGGSLCQTPFPQEIDTNIEGAGHYIQQMHRWYLFATLLMRKQTLSTNLLIGLLYGTPALIFWCLLVSTLLSPSWSSLALLVLVVGIREYTIVKLQKLFSGYKRNQMYLSLLSELLQPIHLLHAYFNRCIRWRSRSYRVYDNDHFVQR